MGTFFGSIATEAKRLQTDAGSYQRDMTSIYREKWQEIRTILLECPTVAECNEMIKAVGFDFSEQEKMYGHDKICNAMLYGKDLKTDIACFGFIIYCIPATR